MPNILFISENEDFAADVKDQIAHHAKDFNFIDSEDKNAVPDIIMIDENLNKLRELHGRYIKAPVFLFTSRPEDVDRDLHLNHLIVKPFSLEYFLNELQASINIFENSRSGYLMFNRYVVRPVKKDILNQRNNEIVKLTEKEIAILKYLYKAQDRIVAKNELLQEVWGYAPDVTTHTIETHVYRLRQKVEHDDPEAQLIITLEGGYRLKL